MKFQIRLYVFNELAAQYRLGAFGQRVQESPITRDEAAVPLAPELLQQTYLQKEPLQTAVAFYNLLTLETGFTRTSRM